MQPLAVCSKCSFHLIEPRAVAQGVFCAKPDAVRRGTQPRSKQRIPVRRYGIGMTKVENGGCSTGRIPLQANLT